jgi:hypothetical protein
MESTNLELIFRGREYLDEDITKGLCATNSGSVCNPWAHVLGNYQNSPYISFSKRLDIATYFGSTNAM